MAGTRGTVRRKPRVGRAGAKAVADAIPAFAGCVVEPVNSRAGGVMVSYRGSDGVRRQLRVIPDGSGGCFAGIAGVGNRVVHCVDSLRLGKVVEMWKASGRVGQ